MRWDKYFAQIARRIFIAAKAFEIRAKMLAGRFFKNALRYFNAILNNINNIMYKLRSHKACRMRGESTGRLHTAVNKIRRCVLRKAGGNTVLVAKVAVSAFSVVMGFLVLIICVYVIIPSMISDAAHYFEHDLAIQLYNRTLKDKDISAFVGISDNQQIVFPRDCFSSVLKQNPEIVGRLTISALNIGYLVTQHTDNTYYLRNGYNQRPGVCGTIFLDSKCSANQHPPKGHYILYGKDMPNGTMFGSLRQYGDADFFKINDTLRFDTLYGDFEWKVFSAYETVQYEQIISNCPSFGGEKWLYYLEQLAAKSLHFKDINFSPGDVLLTLCTDVSPAGSRFVVHAKLVS